MHIAREGVLEEMKNNLKQIRELKGLEQADVAGDLGLSLSTYRSWEQGARGLNGEKLVMFARYFGVSTDTILGTEFSKLHQEKALTPDESRLIAAYRTLDNQQQQTVLSMVEGLANK